MIVCAGPDDRSNDVEVVSAVVEGMPEQAEVTSVWRIE